MGLDDPAAVCDSARRGDHLDRRDREVLTEGRDRQVGVEHIALYAVVDKELVVGFTGQVDARFVREAESLVVFPELRLTDQLTDLYETGVTGVVQTFLVGLRAVTRGIMTVDGIFIELVRTGTTEATFLIDDAFFQRHRQRDHLENGAGIVGVRDRLVAPVTRQRRALRLSLRFGDQLLFLGIADIVGILFIFFDISVFDQILGVDRVDLLFLIRVDGKGIVEVKAVDRSHREDLAGVNVHHDAYAALMDLVVDNALLHVLFHDALDGLVDRQHQRAAVDRADVLVVVKGHLGRDTVLSRNDTTGRTREIIVVLELYAPQTLILGTGEADDRRREVAVGIVALIVVEQRDHTRLLILFTQLILQLDDLILFGTFDPALDRDIVGVLLGILQQLRFIEAQDLREPLCDISALFIALFAAVKVRRSHDDAPNGRRLRQDLAVRIIDRSALCGDRRIGHLLFDRFTLELFALYQLQKSQTGDDRAEADRQDDNQQPNGSSSELLIRSQCENSFLS